MQNTSNDSKFPWCKDALLTLACLLLVFGFLFRESFEKEKVVFANDAPLGAIQAHAFDEKVGGWSYWQDLNWVGGEFPSAMPNFTKGFFELSLLLGGEDGVVLFAKWYQPGSLVLLGFCSWLFFRSLRFSAPVCLLGALALALNGDLFSYTSWGLASVALGAAGALLAMTGVINGLRETGWRMVAWVVLGGLGLGQGVMESFDVGGIFSLYVAVFVIAAALNREGVGKKEWPPAFAKGAGILVLVVLASTLMSWHTLHNLLRTEGGAAISNKVGIEEQVNQLEQTVAQQLAEVQTHPQLSPAQKLEISGRMLDEKNRLVEMIRNQPFDVATQWSVPPIESLRMVIPGLYGYRESPHGWMPHPVDGEQQYWGRVGQTPGFTRIQDEYPVFSEAMAHFQKTYGGGPMLRHASSGIYMGLMVLVVALWGLLQACRGEAGAFGLYERRWIFFWALLALMSLVLAWGQHAPFYKFIYQLPFFNVIRNPIKFMHPCSMAMVILFTYGLQGMAREYLVERKRAKDVLEQFKLWLGTLKGWDRKWAFGMLAMAVVGILGWLFYAALQSELRKVLISGAGFTVETASALATGSLMSAGLSVIFLAATLITLAIFMSGVIPKKQSVVLWGLMGLLLCVDLVVGSLPHLVFYDWQQKYASNGVIEILRKRPFEQRVCHSTGLVVRELQQIAAMQQQAQTNHTTTNLNERAGLNQYYNIWKGKTEGFHRIYHSDWKQALFPFHGIHALDVIQDPRPDPRDSAYRSALNQSAEPHLLWELTSTRYLLGNSFQFAKDLDRLAGTTNQFTVLRRFEIEPVIGHTNAYTATISTNGHFALVSFDGALPRAGVYAYWRSGMPDNEILATLPRSDWDPHREVLISEEIPSPESPDANATVTPARYLSYDPKHVVIETDAKTSTVLLLNDKHHPEWRVTIDGAPAKLLRANYLMRGVHLPKGKHTVEFQFEPAQGSIKISLAGFGLGALSLLVLLMLPKPPPDDGDEEEEVVEVPPVESKEGAKDQSDGPQNSKTDDTSSKDERRGSSRQKSRSRSGRRKRR